MGATEGLMRSIMIGTLFFIASWITVCLSHAASPTFPNYQPLRTFAVKNYQCRPAARKSVHLLQEIEKPLTGHEQVLSKYYQLGLAQDRVPALLFIVAAEEISKAYREHGHFWKEQFCFAFPEKVHWDVMNRYVNGSWSTWLDKEQAEHFVFKRSVVPDHYRSREWFLSYVWGPAKQRTEELFSRYQQDIVNPLKVGWAAIMSELSKRGLCEEKTGLTLGAECNQTLARVKSAIRKDLINADQLYARWVETKMAAVDEIPRKLLRMIKDWQFEAAQIRSDCPQVANYIDHSLNRWLCKVGPTEAETLSNACPTVDPSVPKKVFSLP